MTPIRALILAALALALWLTAGIASADEPAEPQTATRLHPGVNLIGWVGETTPVSQLFREIPQLEAVWTWDAEFDEWIVAARNAPEWLGGLGRVTAGMGLRMQLSGDAPVTWNRSTEPTRGLVRLRTGWNLVAWSGADGAPIENVAKGIGWSLRSIRRWDAATQQWATWTSPERSAQVIADTGGGEEAETPGVRRGEALWVEVSRSVNWLQPTDILPRLVFPGGASQVLQTRVREDLEAVLAFYRDQYGIQAEPDFTVYVAKDADALIQAYKDDGEEVDDAYEASTRALWNRVGGWAGGEIVVKQSSWTDDLSTSAIAGGRYLLTHEYFHVLQSQLSDGWAATWLVEGTAEWGHDEHRVMDDQRTWQDRREARQSLITVFTPSLQSVEIKPEIGLWEYELGWLAVDQLTTAAGPDSWVEFWRRLGFEASSWEWRGAFQEVFGRSVEEFYAGFETWQREQEQEKRYILGAITTADGQPLADTAVWACREVDDECVGLAAMRRWTDNTGMFVVIVPTEGRYRLWLNLEGCEIYFRRGGFTTTRSERSTVHVEGRDVRLNPLQIPAEMCAHQIKGSITTSDGQPLTDTRVRACREVGNGCVDWTGRHTDADGTFAITVPTEGRYRLWLNLEGCEIYFRRGGFTTTRSERSTVHVEGRSVRLNPRQIPAEMCAHRISGRFLDASGAPLAHKLFSAFGPGGSGSVWTDANGRFEIRVPSDGAYTFNIWLTNDCSHRFGGRSLGGPDRPIRVSGADVSGVVLRLPDTIENLCK